MWAAWGQLQGQWRTGMAGNTGLDFAAVTAWLRAHGYGHSRRRNLRAALGDIAAMESAALNAWAEKAALTHPSHT